MAAFKQDPSYSTALKKGPRRYSAPFASNEFCVFEQDYQQLASAWTATTLGTASPDFPTTFWLVKESDHMREGGLVTWTRTYSSLPTAWDEYGTMAYNFIGFAGLGFVGINQNLASITGRNRFSKVTKVRIHHEYFRIGSVATPTVADVTLHQALTYYVTSNPNLFVDYLADSPFIVTTTPSRATYEGWITTPTEIVAETSDLHRWQGVMFEMMTKYIYPE